jgi:hypothetical protein
MTTAELSGCVRQTTQWLTKPSGDPPADREGKGTGYRECDPQRNEGSIRVRLLDMVQIRRSGRVPCRNQVIMKEWGSYHGGHQARGNNPDHHD